MTEPNPLPARRRGQALTLHPTDTPMGARPSVALTDPLTVASYADALCKLAPLYIQSGLAPSGMTKEQFAIIGLEGVALGIPIPMALRLLFVSKKGNRIGMMVDLQWSLAMAAGAIEDWQVLEHTDALCRVLIKRRGMSANESSYTIEEAKSAGLLSKDNWVNDPKAMLMARAKGRALKPFADLWNGLPTKEDVDDLRDIEATVVPGSAALREPRVDVPAVASAGAGLAGSGGGEPTGDAAPRVDPVPKAADYVIPSGSEKGKRLADVPVATCEEMLAYLDRPEAKLVNEKWPEFKRNLVEYLA